MYIHEAIQKAAKKQKAIYRCSDKWPKGLSIIPTNTWVHCILVTPERECGRDWVPQSDDLTASDWEVTA